MTEISGKVAVVTGGGSGIGKGLSLELARQGASTPLHIAHIGERK
jgi:3-oxoacyl-[acyl-carrier protein] reductase